MEIKSTKLIDKFYNQVLKNLESKNIFYQHFNKKYTYQDLKNNYIKFDYYSKKNNLGDQVKICTLFNKSFLGYSTIISIILSNNVWIPLSDNNPIDRNLKIIKKIKPKLIFVDQTNYLKLKSLKIKINGTKIINIENFYSKLKNKNIKKIFDFNDYKNYQNGLAMIFFYFRFNWRT